MDSTSTNTLSPTKVTSKKPTYIPYSTIYLSKDEVRKNGYWISSLPIHASIVRVYHEPSSNIHIWNPFLYVIELEHGRYKWTVVKRYNDFSYLSNRLLAHRAVERIKAPMRRARNVLERLGENITTTQEDECEMKDLKRSTEIDEYNSKFEILESSVDYVDVESFEASKNQDYYNLPHFPLIPDSMISVGRGGEEDVHMEERRKRLEKWLKGVLNTSINREYHETAEFLEVSRYSFINELGGKYKEGLIKKRPGGNKVFMGWRNFCLRWFTCWKRRWLMIKDSYVAYMDPSTERIKLVMMFDEQFGINEIPLALRHREFILSNSQFILTLKSKLEDETNKWVQMIKNTLETSGQIWLRKKPFGSTFPLRTNSYCEWFVDAKSCWKKISALIEMAREEVFITDWWLSPEIFLRRPIAEGNYWRLDHVLKRCAERGVRIFILIYKEMEMAIGLNSSYTKKHLQSLHSNIKVIRHPDHYIGSGTFFWAHHEKLLIIDQLIAFVGGLDLCYGRWDDSSHKLIDLGSAQIVPRSFGMEAETDEVDGKTEIQRLSQDIMDDGKKIGEIVTVTAENKPQFVNIPKPQVDTNLLSADSIRSKGNIRGVFQQAIEKITRGRTPSGNSFTGLPAFTKEEGIELKEPVSRRGNPAIRFSNLLSANTWDDVSRHTNLDNSDTSQKLTPKQISLITEPRSNTLIRKVMKNLRPSTAKRRWNLVLKPEADITDYYVLNYCRLQETTVDLSDLQGAGKLWPGKDYVNCFVKDFVNVQDAFSDFINRFEVPRMPWHDIHSVVYGSSARDLARHFIQRWNSAKAEKFGRDDNYPYLLPKSYNSIRIPHIFFDDNTHHVETQVIRSVSHWSTQIDATEDSIHRAYLSLIEEAEHYIYIENQFFVSMINSADVGNEIARAIFDRIVRAHNNKETFRVYILLPGLPGFEGDIGVTDAATLLAVVNWTMLSISKGDHSIIKNLIKAGVTDVRKYISFSSLRTHDNLCGKLVTELVYIHSKLMIVDDRRVIIGSANINDRSQLGDRDSEVCILVTDVEFESSLMNGKAYKSGKFASSLRKALMKEHLGLLEEHSFHRYDFVKNVSFDDPVAEHFYNDIWCNVASSNTEIFEDVFKCYPTNKAETLEQLRSYRSEQPTSISNPELAKTMLLKLVGNLIDFPVKFLRNEDLSPAITTKEGLVPNVVFT